MIAVTTTEAISAAIVVGAFSLLASVVGGVSVIVAARIRRRLEGELATGNDKRLGATVKDIESSVKLISSRVALQGDTIIEQTQAIQDVRADLKQIESYYRSVEPLREWVQKQMRKESA